MFLYFDNNATTRLDDEVFEAMRPYLAGFVGNASSKHAAGRLGRQAIDRAKLQIANAVGAQPDQIFFTSGATEANNLAIASTPPSTHVLVSPTEHPSALDPARKLQRRGCVVEELHVAEDGTVFDLETKCRPETALVVIQLANSETGCIQPIAQLTASVGESTRFHCDATQAVGKIPVDFDSLNVSSLSLSGHKIYGPTGIGALIVRDPDWLKPMMYGGHQQRDIRPGTEPVAAIAGFGKAVEIAVRDLATATEHMRQMRNLLESLLLAQIPDSIVNGGPHRLPNTCNISFLGAKAQAVLMAADLAGLCCSAGSACASGSLEPSAVLKAMGISGSRLDSAIRLSVGKYTTATEVERAVAILAQAVANVRRALRSA